METHFGKGIHVFADRGLEQGFFLFLKLKNTRFN